MLPCILYSEQLRCLRSCGRSGWKAAGCAQGRGAGVSITQHGVFPHSRYQAYSLLQLCGGELLETLEARARRAEQRRSSRIPLNPPPPPSCAAEKARKAAAAEASAPPELPTQRKRKAAGSYQVLAGKGFGGY
jgi:hypothetical protein